VRLVGHCVVAAVTALAMLAGCSTGGSKASAPTTTAATFEVPSPQTTRDPRLDPRCLTATLEVVNYLVAGELRGRLPVGGGVPVSEYAKPAFHALVLASLNDCSRAEWRTAMQDYVHAGAHEMDVILQAGCRIEQVAHRASADVDGGVVVPVPAACH
jgi:hypothetical protein